MPAWRSAAPNSVAPRPARGVSSPSHARIARLSGSRSATAARIARPPKLTSAQSANARTTIPRTSRPRRVRNPSRAPPPKTTSGAESTAMASGSGRLRVSTSTAEIGRSSAGARSDGVSFEVALLRSQATDAPPVWRKQGQYQTEAPGAVVSARGSGLESPEPASVVAAMARSTGRMRQADAARRERLRPSRAGLPAPVSRP